MSNELKKAIETARRVHDRMTGPADGTCVIIGALIRAVELIAVRTQRLEKAETSAGEAYAFPDELIARLRLVQQNAIRESLENDGTCHPDVALRAVLSELAKAPVELPTTDELAKAAHYGQLANFIRGHYAPVLAAKDVELSELRAFKSAHESFLAQSDVTHRILDETGVPNREPTMRNEMRVLKMQDRVARIIQEKQDALDDAKYSVQSELIAKDARVANLEKRMAELTATIIVDGKTPGQVMMRRIGRDRLKRC